MTLNKMYIIVVKIGNDLNYTNRNIRFIFVSLLLPSELIEIIVGHLPVYRVTYYVDVGWLRPVV